jgi:HAD superfamily hydrolase (TIGR01509 family)
MPQFVIFDVDGTLVDSVDLHAQAWADAFHHFGYQVGVEQIRTQIGKGGDQLMPVFVPKADLDRIGKDLDAWRGEHFHAQYLPRIRGFPGVRPLFEALLARGVRMALGSSSKERDLQQLKKAAGIADLDLVEVTSADAERSKPHPDIFQATLTKLGAAPGDTVAVGDTPYDAEAAGKAGITAVGVLCGGFPEADLRRAGCVAIYRDPEDLLAKLDGSPLLR